MNQIMKTGMKLGTLHRRMRLNLNVNDLRIMVGCLRAVSYLMKMDDEPYLDDDALELQRRLERTYSDTLQQRTSHRKAS